MIHSLRGFHAIRHRPHHRVTRGSRWAFHKLGILEAGRLGELSEREWR